MSRRNQDLVSRVRFEVDSRMANATMQALQTHAEKLNQQVAEVNASIKALGDVPDDSPALLEYRKQLRRLNSDLKDVNTTMKDYTRGVKAAGELYRHYAMGNIEDMSIKAIRAGVNGMKKRLDNLKAGGDPGDAEEMRLIEAITTEADVVVKRFKTDYQHVVEEITRGGTVTEQTLKRTRDGLADLMQTAETEAEKNELTNYWQKVGAAIEAVAVENRRLRGEVADREEAMRIAYATDHDGSQQAIHDAEARADAARRENDELRQRLDLKQQQRRELEQEMDINSMQVRSLMDRRDELKAQEKEDRAIRNQRVDDANKELNAARRAAKTQQQAYDEQKQTVEKLRTEVQGLTDDIRKMGEVKAEPKIDTSELEAKLAEANRVLGNASAYEKLAQAKLDGMRSVLTEQGTLLDSKQAELRKFTDATYDLQSRRDELNWAIEPFSRKGRSSGRYHFDIHDVEQQRVAVEKLDEAFRRLADDDYFKNASLARKYELLGTSAFGYSDAEQQFGSYERAIRSLGVAAEESGAKFRLLFQGAGVDKSFQGVEFLDGYVSRRKEIAQLNAEIKKALGDTNIDELAREVDHIAGSYNKLAGEVQEQEQEVARWGKLRQEYADNAAAAERELAAAQQQSTTATASQSEALKQQEQELEKLNQKIQKLKQDGMYDPAEGSVQDAIAERKRLISDYEKEAEKASRGMDRSKEGSKTYEKHWEEWSDADQWREAYEIQLKALQELEKTEKEKLELEQKIAAAQQQSTTATAAQTEALKQQEQELESLKKDLTDATNDLNRSQGNLAESLKPLEELGLKEADLEDKAKLRAAAEKKVLEIMEAQANVEKEVAEQSRKIISELKPNALGGTKADQDFYAKNKNAYAIDDNIDDVMDRIAHLETVSKLKNGRKFSDDTYWDPDDELDESEAVVMTDKEKQNALDELRVLKQHVREVILKAIREVGDVDKAVLEVTGGDGVAEDTKFGEQINDKISDLKDKIQEQITTTLESYEDILDEVDRDEKLSKQEVERRVNSHIEYLKDNVARDRDDIDYFQGQVSDANTAIAAKEKEIELTKQQTTAQQQSAQSSEQLAQKQEQLSQKTAELNRQQDKLNGMVDETVTANQRLARAEQEQTDARNAQAEAKKHEGEAVKKVEDELRGLTDEQLKNAQAYSHLTEEINADTAAMQRNITTEQEATREADRLRSGSIDKMEQALARLRESNRKLDPTIDKEEWERGERAIGQLTLRLEELKKQSAELRREPVLDMMTQRMDQLGTLSRDALTETKKFWEQMVAGAEKGSGELADYEQHLKSIALEEQARVREQGREAFAFFQREDYRRTNAANTEEQRKALVAYRDTIPVSDTRRIEEINALLEKQAQFVKEAAGEWMSLEKAMELAKTAGTDQFAGSAKDIQLATQSLERQRDTIIATIREKRNLGQATKAEEDQLADLTKKLRSLKFEQDNVNMSQEKMRTLIETPANAVNLDELRAAIKRADGQLRQMQQSLGENSSEYKRFAEQVRNAKNVMKEMEGQAKASATAWEKAVSRIKTYVVLYMGFNELWQKITGTMGDMLELSDKMGEVMKTTQFSADQVARLSDNLKDLDTRTPMVKLMELSSIAGSIGLKTQQQVEGFTDAANQLMVALPEMGTEAARTLMKIADATGDLEKNGGDVRETLERVGSTIIALRANSAAAAGPITDFVSRVGAVGAQAGISIDQIAALGATVDALGGRVEMSATALSRMIPAIRNNSFAVANAIGMTEKELKGMTAMEQMVAIFKALRDSVKQFDTSTDEGMNAMADKVEQMLGNSASMQEVMKTLNQQGARAGIVFGLLSQNVDKLEEQLTTATDAYRDNAALMEEYNKMNDTAAARWERLKNQLEEFWVTADNTSVLAGIIDGLRVLVDFLTEDGPLGRFFRWSLVYLGMWQAGWTKAIGTALISLHQYIFATSKSTVATAGDTAAKAANTAATEAQAVASGKAAAAQGLFNKTMKANVIAAVATAVVALGFALYEYIKKAKAAARQMDVMADVEKKAREESVKERAELERLYKATQDQTKSMEERKKALKDMVGDAKYKEYYSKLNTESELAKAAASAYKELAEQIIATARARALDAKAEELQRKRIELEDKKTERQQWREENQGSYNAGKQEYDRQQRYTSNVTGGATAGFQESQIAQRGSAAMKPAIIDEFEGNIREINKLESDISQVDADLEKVKKQVEGITGIKGDASGDGNGGGGGGGGTNPYGDYNKVTSPYKDWNGNDLVARRKEMLERVKALANGADVQAVLSEDAKFISEAVRKNIKTTEQAIEWYNTERLKIQEALHGKHLTNTGDWMDPEKVRKRAGRVVQDEMKYYLDELDAYYTERKTRIEQARNDEEITEGEAWRRTIQNDNEWQTRRAELQLLYSRRAAKVTEDEMQAIFDIISERTGETVNYIKADIAQTNKFIVDVGNKSKAAMDRIYGDIELGAEKSYLKAAQAIGKQMKFIEDTLAKERPYDGITKNLQDNLDKMGVLAAKYRRENDELARQGKEPKYSNEQITAQSYDEMAFYLRQAADAYSIDIDELLRRMVKEGMTATAEEISKSDMLKQAVMGQLRKTYQEVQDAIKKEASQIKKDVEIIWNDDARGIGGMSMKATFDKALAQLGMQQDSVSRANSLIGAGAASDNVASRLAMKQIEVQMRMQKAQYDMYRVQANQRMAALKAEAEEHRKLAKQMEKENHLAESKRELLMATTAERDAENVRLSLGLTLAEETKKEEQQKAELLKIQEESQNRLYTSLREWADLLTSSLQGVMEASHAGDAEYYNERAKLDLTGKGGPGAGTYVVIDDAGTSDATAHYEYLDERQALERQHEIEIQNAQAEAWRKLMDDLNMKMSEQITDWMNAYLQNKATEDNTAELQRLQQKLEAEQQKMDASVTATDANTQAVQGLTQQLAEGITIKQDGTQPGTTAGSDFAADKQAGYPSAPQEAPSNVDFASDKQTGYPGAQTDPANTAATDANTQAVQGLTQVIAQQGGFGADKAAGYPSGDMPSVDGGSFDTTDFAASKQAGYPSGGGELSPAAQQQINESNKVTETKIANKQKEVTTSTQGDKKITSSAQSSFAKMTAAANLYGLAYQAMSNDNLSTAQKVQLFAVQAAGNAAIAMLTTDMATTEGEAAVSLPGILGKAASQLGPIAGPIAFAAMSALLGGLMGLAVSKIAKSKSTIAQATGASVGAGRLATGMLTYAEGNVNELTDPASLTPGRQYNVDGADGKTYRARYMGKGAKTHITNGPEFHLVGEKGREAIIDAHTTRLLQMNETGIWRDIQTLYNGGSISGMSTRRRRGGVRAYAEGNVGEFEDMDGDAIAANGTGGGMSIEMLASLQASIDRQSDLLENALVNGIKAVNKWTGSDGIPAMYNKMQKEAQRHGEKYL